MRLLEPLGLLDGEEGEAAVKAGLALPLSGGPLSGGFAYSLARLIEDDAQRLVAAADLPPSWLARAERLALPLPDWAGLGSVLSGGAGCAVMGILNVTPDSFSDGGAHDGAESAIAAGRAMREAGAAIIDIGGESTRPGAPAVSVAEEQARLLPVVSALAREGAVISVDTRNAATMAASLDAGACIVNDVSALTHDPEASALVAARGCAVVLMHMRGTPDTMNRHAQYTDVAVEVLRELAELLVMAEASGIARARIALDPGIGFAKLGAQNHELLRRLPLLLNLGCPILVGVSRKRFIGHLAGEAPPRARLAGSLSAGVFAMLRGASVLRVHDVAETVQAVRVAEALRAGGIAMA